MNENEMINNETVEKVAEAGGNIGKKVAIIGGVLVAATGVVLGVRKVVKVWKTKKQKKAVDEAKEVEGEEVVVKEDESEE